MGFIGWQNSRWIMSSRMKRLWDAEELATHWTLSYKELELLKTKICNRFWDVNGEDGLDCPNHGTQVATAAAGETLGVAKGANLIIAKITIDTTSQPCTNNSVISTSVTAFNWLVTGWPRTLRRAQLPTGVNRAQEYRHSGHGYRSRRHTIDRCYF